MHNAVAKHAGQKHLPSPKPPASQISAQPAVHPLHKAETSAVPTSPKKPRNRERSRSLFGIRMSRSKSTMSLRAQDTPVSPTQSPVSPALSDSGLKRPKSLFGLSRKSSAPNLSGLISPPPVPSPTLPHGLRSLQDVPASRGGSRPASRASSFGAAQGPRPPVYLELGPLDILLSPTGRLDPRVFTPSSMSLDVGGSSSPYAIVNAMRTGFDSPGASRPSTPARTAPPSPTFDRAVFSPASPAMSRSPSAAFFPQNRRPI